MFAANKFLSRIPVISIWHSDTEKPKNKHGILSGLYQQNSIILLTSFFISQSPQLAMVH